MKRTVGDLMKQRDLSAFPFVYHDVSMEEALFALEKFDSGALAVKQGEWIVGMFTERDFARASLTSKLPLNVNRKVSEVMSSNVVYVTQKYRLEECMALMSMLRIRHLPVMEDDRVIALLGMRHIMEALIEDREFMIGELTRYVTGAPVVEQKGQPEVLVRNFSRTFETSRSI